MLNIVIDGRALEVAEGTSILAAARKGGIDIPTLCFMKDRSDIGSCRLCVVSIEGEEHPLPACRTLVREGMVVTTESEQLTTYRRIALELLVAGMKPEVWQTGAGAQELKEEDLNELQQLCAAYGITGTAYPVPFAEKLLQEEKVAIVPGTAFGDCGEGFLRISYAYSIENLKTALERLQRFVQKHIKKV